MKNLINLLIFENDKYFLALVNGYCHARNIGMKVADYEVSEINKIVELAPTVIIVPLTLLTSTDKVFELKLLRQIVINNHLKICALKTQTTDWVPTEFINWLDVLRVIPYSIKEFDQYIVSQFIERPCFTEKRSHRDRRSSMERRGGNVINNIDGRNLMENTEQNNFRVDSRNKCLMDIHHKIMLTPKEYALIELLSSDRNHIFSTDEILARLWPDSDRATKSDLYQYMHLLRKKFKLNRSTSIQIENIKGFGYRLTRTDQSLESNLPVNLEILPDY